MTFASHLTPLLQQALHHVPTGERTVAAKIAVLSVAGFADREIASRLGLSWYVMNQIRSELQGGVMEALRRDGYADTEVTSYLRVPSSALPWPEAP